LAQLRGYCSFHARVLRNLNITVSA
jgi:hypothetical protein